MLLMSAKHTGSDRSSAAAAADDDDDDDDDVGRVLRKA